MTLAAPRPASGASISAVGLVLVGLLCQEFGASFAVLLFPTVGALGMVALRLAFSAILLMAIARPRLRGYSHADWLTVGGFAAALAGMNALFYEALARLPLGPTVTIEVLGPLILSVMVSRRASSWLWALLAFVGVAVLGWGGVESLDPIGVLFAAGAGAGWVAYILLSARTGARFPKLDGLAIAMTLGAIVTLPFGIAGAGPALFSPGILALGAAVAVLSSAIPYALELFALRRLPASAFSILMSLAPAMAAIVGAVVLHQQLTLVGWIAIALVVVASAGAVRSAAAHARRRSDIAEPLA
ncbi:inner membrane transporter RhtA [Okibacterium sp. HSC-33S16]|uniref:EamA family transporter n=1 Tax=Okibacterium sp. HSC-33S16 TaxID=2910965 RepID=UPI0020A1C762|nr:EamA family transporter [Okibacterium sp. HSC-33S16]MCP2032203.1 inner membrane transporter RhtA [Okibacterium sp. HSC-33S16]